MPLSLKAAVEKPYYAQMLTQTYRARARAHTQTHALLIPSHAKGKKNYITIMNFSWKT